MPCEEVEERLILGFLLRFARCAVLLAWILFMRFSEKAGLGDLRIVVGRIEFFEEALRTIVKQQHSRIAKTVLREKNAMTRDFP